MSLADTRLGELEAVNRELDAFTSPVSHDLRASLRASEEFARIVIDEHQRELRLEGQRRLGVVTKNADNMRELIASY